MIIDKAKRLERAGQLQQQMMDAMPMVDAARQLCLIVAELEQERDYYKARAIDNAKAGR